MKYNVANKRKNTLYNKDKFKMVDTFSWQQEVFKICKEDNVVLTLTV